MYRSFLTILIVLMSVTYTGAADEGCGELQQVDITAAADRFSETFAPALAQVIVAGRQAALDQGVKPLPEHLKRAMRHSFDAELLDRTRYTTGVEGATLQALAMKFGPAHAIVLGDVIVFRSEADLESNWLVAHELAHVMQYDAWGTEEFSRRYLRDHSAVEAEADRIAGAWRSRQKADIDADTTGLGPVIVTLPVTCPEETPINEITPP